MQRETKVSRVAEQTPVRALTLLVWLLFVASPLVCAQQPGEAQTPQSEVSAQPEEPREGKHVPIFGNADEFALTTSLEYYEPWPGFNRLNRDISLQVASVALAAHLQQGWEFQFDGLAIRARGVRTLSDVSSSTPNPPQVASNALALGAGPMARWNFLQVNRMRLFVDAEGDLIISDRPFPVRGTIYNFFLHAGGGVSLRVSDSYWIESAFRFAHISNGSCFCAGNPAWNGRGLTIGLRRAFGHESRSSGKPLFAIFQKANEKAWVTSAEYYTSLPGSSSGVNLRVLRISRAWHFPRRIEFQFDGMIQTTEAVAGIGPLLRWNFVEKGPWRLFVDGGADFLQTGSPAYIIPVSGVGYNFSLRSGGGASFRLRRSYWLDTAFRAIHVTSGFGPHASDEFPWSGKGLSLGLRHTFH